MHKVRLVEMRILRWIYGRTTRDRIINELFWEPLGVASIGDKLIESFEMVWTCSIHVNDGAIDKKFFYSG